MLSKLRWIRILRIKWIYYRNYEHSIKQWFINNSNWKDSPDFKPFPITKQHLLFPTNLPKLLQIRNPPIPNSWLNFLLNRFPAFRSNFHKNPNRLHNYQPFPDKPKTNYLHNRRLFQQDRWFTVRFNPVFHEIFNRVLRGGCYLGLHFRTQEY